MNKSRNISERLRCTRLGEETVNKKTETVSTEDMTNSVT